MKPLLLIKTGGTIPEIARGHGDFEDWFAAGLSVGKTLQVDVYRGEDLPVPSAVSSVVITGSAAMVSHREAWSERTADWLREALDRSLPVLGVCYGHQLLAHSLGGIVGPNPNGRQIGTVTVQLEPGIGSDELFGDHAGSFDVQTSHSEVVLELPGSARRLGSTRQDKNHVARFSPTSWGIQYHPEFSAPVTREYIRLRKAELLEEGLDADGLYAGVRETPVAAAILPAFARWQQAWQQESETA